MASFQTSSNAPIPTAISAATAPIMPLCREAEFAGNGETLGLEGLVGLTMRPVPAPPEPLEWSTPVPVGAVVTAEGVLVANFAVLVATTIELEMGTKLGRDEPGLASKVVLGCGSGGMVPAWSNMLSISAPTFPK